MMIRFAVFDEGGPAREVRLSHAYALDKQGYAIPAIIESGEGMITVKPSSAEATAFALNWGAGAAGKLTLQTTPLPARERPYLLDLELARHRIMLMLVKLEEWGLAPLLVEGDPLLAELDAARDLMTAALCEPGTGPGVYTAAQASTARRALERAVLASETLAMRASEAQLAARLEDGEGVGEAAVASKSVVRGVPRPLVGCVVHNERFTEPLQQAVRSTFDYLSSPMRWNEIEAEEGRYNFRSTDRWIEWAVKHGRMAVHAGPVLDFHPRAFPEWATIWEHDYETLREFAYEHCARVAKRYRRAVRRWVALSGPTVVDGVRFTIDQWVDLARLSTLAIRKAAPNAAIAVEVALPFGQHPGGSEAVVSPRFFAEMLQHGGVQFDSLSLRVQLGSGAIGESARDLMQLSALIDDYAEFEHVIDVSVLGMPSAMPRNTPVHLEPGYWHSASSGETQGEFVRRAMTVLMGKAAVRSVAWQSLYDLGVRPEQADGGLVSVEGRAKPGLVALRDVSRALREGRVPTMQEEEAADGAAAG